MRIRSIKPEFWAGLPVATVAYQAPFPRGHRPYKDMPGMVNGTEYVYVLSDSADEVVYVGRSFCPSRRFTSHRRKPWWPSVESVLIYRIDGEDRTDAEQKSALFEAALIEELSPSGNIAKGQRRQGWYGQNPYGKA